MSKMINDAERQRELYCTPPHISKALLNRETFPGTIWEPAAGRGHIVTVLTQCGYPDVRASDMRDWGFPLSAIDDFLTSSFISDSIITNPPFSLLAEFLAQAKRLARFKIAMLAPVTFEYTVGFLHHHEYQTDFPWKAMYSFVQGIPWSGKRGWGGRMKHAWFVFERGYRGPVIRKKITFGRNNSIPRRAQPANTSVRATANHNPVNLSPEAREAFQIV